MTSTNDFATREPKRDRLLIFLRKHEISVVDSFDIIRRSRPSSPLFYSTVKKSFRSDSEVMSSEVTPLLDAEDPTRRSYTSNGHGDGDNSVRSQVQRLNGLVRQLSIRVREYVVLHTGTIASFCVAKILCSNVSYQGRSECWDPFRLQSTH